MPEMTKSNAREMLERTLSRFRKVTGQRTGAVFTWDGGLSILAHKPFTDFINANKDTVWNTLATSPTSFDSVPTHDLEMATSIQNDLLGSSVKTLRKMISWIIQKSLKKTRNYWGKEEEKTIWCPEEIPFSNISRRSYKKSTLIQIIEAYKRFNSGGTESPQHSVPEFRDRSPLHTSRTNDIKEREDIIDAISLFEDEVIISNVVDCDSNSKFPIEAQSNDLNILPLHEISNDSFLPGLTTPQIVLHDNIRLPEITSQELNSLPSSIAVLANARPILPIDVKFTVFQERTKKEFLDQLSNSQTFLSGLCINSFMDLLKKCFPKRTWTAGHNSGKGIYIYIYMN